MERLIFHVDVNSAYLSWEAARRIEQGQPDIRLIPSAIGGDREKRTGIILAKSIPAKKFGVQTGEPVSQALRKCPDLFLAKPDFRLYERNSAAFMDICRKYAPVVEKYSIDECFLDMSGTGRLYPDPVALAHRIKDEIRDSLGFTVNVGIGNCKLCAKMASDFQKPDMVHTLFQHQIPDKLWPLPIGELFSVGSATAQRLKKARIHTVGDLARQELASVQRIVGQKLGAQIHAYANGIDTSPVRQHPEEPKGYSISTTVETDITATYEADKVLLALSDSVTARMRADGVRSGCIAVSIRSNDFKTRSHQRTLSEPTDISSEVFRLSKDLFREIWDGVTPLRLLGISLTELCKEDNGQYSLFRDEEKEKARKLDKTIDAIRTKYGSGTLVRASSVVDSIQVGKKYQAQLENKAYDHKEEEK